MTDGAQDPSTRMRTPLLTLITAEALERDYQMVAQRRIARGDQPGGRDRISGRAGVVAVVAAFGVLLTIAAVQTNANADIDNASRESLIERIEARRSAVQDLQRQIADLRERNARGEDALLDLGDEVNDVEAEATALGAATGFTPVTGQGIRIELDNAANSDPDTEHIRDSDFALLVNALWTAGAEAIAINGQRISSRTAIRNSGTAIEVNSSGIAPPYLVQAVGNNDALLARLVETSSGAAFSVLAGDYGWLYETDNVDDMRIPAAPLRLRQLRSASLATDSGRQPEGDG
ncbi:DUF881 domain-containing protein [Nocardioides bizhenqiangii]|uniref:DUF881 domain-containing protein n=1 Tax=Nocardioides bizhenqiangii TaxID=3095076 RepID=A0ABZ0ZL26_9ACTN|nr:MULTISPECIES: DUF881 domain-containing protein [unclassified Nocardioides]MDZ5620132.1 DUF881 domain-containing protein [Nocardioides sp. HM23]MDZ5623459.1 DUF881 domain-containing protein [Nocardioides sp. HM23]WQQ24509.1 DUF881 domain-containing protein [Nocardioides sp. HM61]